MLIDGEKYLQLVSQEPYSATSEGVQAVYKQCLNSMSGICAWNTSRLAFDGSGKVERGEYYQNGERKYNYSICLFKIQYRSQLRYYTVFLHKSALSLINVDKVRVVPVP